MEGEQTENPEEMVDIFVKYFNDTLNNYDLSNSVNQEEMLKCIPKLISK